MCKHGQSCYGRLLAKQESGRRMHIANNDAEQAGAGIILISIRGFASLMKLSTMAADMKHAAVMSVIGRMPTSPYITPPRKLGSNWLSCCT